MPTDGNYLCGCGRFMRPKKNGVMVEELMENGQPYKLWEADLWQCPECGAEIVSGFAPRPLAEHWQLTYADTRARERIGSIIAGRCRAKVTA